MPRRFVMNPKRAPDQPSAAPRGLKSAAQDGFAIGSTKGILGFIFLLLVIYGLLAAPWPGVQGAYSRFYMGAGNWAFGSFGSKGEVHFLPLAKPTGLSDIEVVTKIRGARVEGWSPHSSRMMGYLPTVEVVALVLATPIPWRRRWKALLCGLIICQAFIALRILICLVHWFSADRPWQLFYPGRFWGDVLTGTQEIVNVSPTLSFVAPVFIWIVVTFRRADWEAALTKFQAP